eukprot:9472635-Pyramimonas_sp.AAC.1
MMGVNGEDEGVDFDPDSLDAQPSAQGPIVPDSSQQGDLPARDALPTPTQEPPPAPAQAMSAVSSDEQARRSRSHPRLRDDPHPQGRLP